MKKVADMIKELLAALRDAGVTVPDDAAHKAEVRIQQQFGGAPVYVPKLKKRIGQSEIAHLGTCSAREVARITGKPIRTVQRLRSGK